MTKFADDECWSQENLTARQGNVIKTNYLRQWRGSAWETVGTNIYISIYLYMYIYIHISVYIDIYIYTNSVFRSTRGKLPKWNNWQLLYCSSPIVVERPADHPRCCLTSIRRSLATVQTQSFLSRSRSQQKQRYSTTVNKVPFLAPMTIKDCLAGLTVDSRCVKHLMAHRKCSLYDTPPSCSSWADNFIFMIFNTLTQPSLLEWFNAT